MIPVGTVTPKGGVSEITVGALTIGVGVNRKNGIPAMTDTQRVMILLTAIRCILALDERAQDPLRLRLIKSVLIEAVQQCARGSFPPSSDIIQLIITIENEVAMQEAAQ